MGMVVVVVVDSFVRKGNPSRTVYFYKVRYGTVLRRPFAGSVRHHRRRRRIVHGGNNDLPHSIASHRIPVYVARFVSFRLPRHVIDAKIVSLPGPVTCPPLFNGWLVHSFDRSIVPLAAQRRLVLLLRPDQLRRRRIILSYCIVL